MKAIQLVGKEKIRLVDIPKPVINDDEVLLKIRAASICGTDVRMFNNGYKDVSENNPLVLGHEFAGDIVEVGKNVKGLTVGMKVAVAPNIGCGHCDECVRGRTHLCEDMRAFGINMPGGFAEYVKIPKEAIIQGNVSPLENDISYQEAALVEPLSCVYNGQKLIGVNPGDDVLIIGLGPIGIMHIMVAKLFGVGRIFVNDLSVERIKKAKELFPNVYPIEGDIKQGFEKYGIKGVDLCIIAAPAGDAQSASLEYMNMNGKLLFFGGLAESKKIVPINSNLIHYKQLRIQGCTKQSVGDYRLCAKLVNDKAIPLDLIVSESYSIENFEEALQNAIAAKGLKHVIEYN